MEVLAGGAELLLAAEVLLALLQEARLKQEVQVKGQQGQRLQEKQQLLEQGLARPLGQGQETPRVVVGSHYVFDRTGRQEDN